MKPQFLFRAGWRVFFWAAGLWAAFKQRYAGRLKPHCQEVGDWLVTQTNLAEAREGPRCLTHNDFRPDNMMFGTAAGGHPITVLDWQSFAYFLPFNGQARSFYTRTIVTDQ